MMQSWDCRGKRLFCFEVGLCLPFVSDISVCNCYHPIWDLSCLASVFDSCVTLALSVNHQCLCLFQVIPAFWFPLFSVCDCLWMSSPLCMCLLINGILLGSCCAWATGAAMKTEISVLLRILPRYLTTIWKNTMAIT